MKNRIIFIDDVYEDINLIKGEISRNFSSLVNSGELTYYPDNEEEFIAMSCNLEMIFGNDTDKIQIAKDYFNGCFNGDILIFIIDYHFNNQNFDGIRIFDIIIYNYFDYQLTLFFTAKGAKERDIIINKINQTYKNPPKLFKKPYFKDSSGVLKINNKILHDGNLMGILKDYIGITAKHVSR